ncbi:hypothetical protein F5B22DRAFT_652624 [Xylaria bambusicola]|uniref:uncharacterized protein n=1 Tax=Xylaria bambusicola TaxID=326684 RepID=UPI00200749D4|nr:uncharacterized protein F5B22DRAFT_652624 [Xylaria bambusicola]KAI0502899.1 hypothetical protein F5B22DRAFT_652624 [Xylaria bambusicola]
MDALRQRIAVIDSMIIVARQWLREAPTRQDAEQRRADLDRLEADLVAQQARLNALMLAEQIRVRTQAGS